MTKLLSYLRQLVSAGFHGTVHIRLWNGEVKKVTAEQDFILDTLPVEDDDQS